MPRTCCVEELSCAPYLREPISMFATVTEAKRDITRDASTQQSGSIVELMASRDQLRNASPRTPPPTTEMGTMHNMLMADGIYIENWVAATRRRSPAPKPPPPDNNKRQ